MVLSTIFNSCSSYLLHYGYATQHQGLKGPQCVTSHGLCSYLRTLQNGKGPTCFPSVPSSVSDIQLHFRFAPQHFPLQAVTTKEPHFVSKTYIVGGSRHCFLFFLFTSFSTCPSSLPAAFSIRVSPSYSWSRKSQNEYQGGVLSSACDALCALRLVARHKILVTKYHKHFTFPTPQASAHGEGRQAYALTPQRCPSLASACLP